MPKVPDHVALFILKDANSRVLLQHKTNDYWYHPNGWAIFGGAIEPGEKPEDTIRREAKEELGIELSEMKLVKRFEFQTTREYFVFKAPLEHPVEQLEKQLKEGAGLALFDARQIEQLDLLRNHREILKYFFATEKGKN